MSRENNNRTRGSIKLRLREQSCNKGQRRDPKPDCQHIWQAIKISPSHQSAFPIVNVTPNKNGRNAKRGIFEHPGSFIFSHPWMRTPVQRFRGSQGSQDILIFGWAREMAAAVILFDSSGFGNWSRRPKPWMKNNIRRR